VGCIPHICWEGFSTCGWHILCSWPFFSFLLLFSIFLFFPNIVHVRENLQNHEEREYCCSIAVVKDFRVLHSEYPIQVGLNEKDPKNGSKVWDIPSNPILCFSTVQIIHILWYLLSWLRTCYQSIGQSHCVQICMCCMSSAN
jgi:hypothetical protein